MNTTLLRTEKKIKQVLEGYLNSQGWNAKIAWGSTHGIDIEANRGQDRWIIEVKGWENLEDTMANSFAMVLGKILQRMDEPWTKYSIALLDTEQYRRLWKRLSALVKNKTGITALFVMSEGAVTEMIH